MPQDTGRDQGSYNSLRQAVDRILGASPGGSGTPAGGGGMLGSLGSGAPQQSSDITLSQKNLGTVAGVQNTPFTSPQDQALADAKAATAQAQQNLNSLNAPAVAATPAVAAAPAGPQQMISKYDLYELQGQKQREFQEADRARQIANLRAQGYRPDQLNFAPLQFNTNPTNWGNQTNYMKTTMVPNPYAK